MNEDQDVTVGVDTHKDVHVAAVLDQAGRVLDTRSFPTTTRGYAQLATWAESLGTVVAVGMEGTGSYGAGLLRFLTVRTTRGRGRPPGPLHSPPNWQD